MKFQMLEIDFLDLMRKLLKKWKLIIVIGLVGLLLGGTFAMVTGRAYQTISRKSSEEMLLEEIEMAKSGLSDRQQTLAENNYKIYCSITKQKDEVLKYLESSVFMNLDPQTAINEQLYYILGMEGNGTAISEILHEMICDNTLCDEVNKTLGQEISLEDLNDLIVIRNDKDDDSSLIISEEVSEGIIIDIFGPNKEFCQTIKDAVENKIDFLRKEKIGNQKCSMTKAGERVLKFDIKYLTSKYQVYSSRMSSLDNYITIMNNSMSDGEKDYYKLLVKQNSEESLDDESQVVETKRLLSKKSLLKYMLAFGILFAGAYVFIFAAKYVFAGKLHNVDMLNMVFDIHPLCEVNADENLLALEEIRYLAAEDPAGLIGVMTSTKDAKVNQLIASMKEADQGKNIVVLNARPKTEEDFESLKSVKGIVIVEKEEVSKAEEVAAMVTYYKNKKIPMDGVIVVK